jgi:hypothetical protein
MIGAPMRLRSRHLLLCTAGAALAFLLGAVAHSNAASGTAGGPTGTVFCPFSASELTAIVGLNLRRVALGGGRASGQCAFSAVEGGKAIAPQIYLTLDPGNAVDLHNSYRYYVGARTQLAARPQVKARPDLGAGAFTLTVPDAHVTNAFFLSGDNIATLSLDLADAPRPEKIVVAQILALAAKRAA